MKLWKLFKKEDKKKKDDDNKEEEKYSSARRSTRRTLSLSVTFSLIVLSFCYNYFFPLPKNKLPIPENIDAVITIAAGDYSPIRLITGLRRMGGFEKPIYVLTNRHDNITQYGAVPIPMGSFLEMPADLNKTSGKMTTKWLKSQIFKAVPDTVSTILYIDADVQINSPLMELERFLSLSLSEECDAYFFAERFYVEDNLNSGVGIFFRSKSKHLLMEWSGEILSGQHQRDQAALNALLERQVNSMQVCTLPFYLNYYTTDSLAFLANCISFGWRRRRSIFLHPTQLKNLTQMNTPDDGTSSERFSIY